MTRPFQTKYGITVHGLRWLLRYCWFVGALILLAAPAQAQRPTAEYLPSPTAFWPVDPATGTVIFAGHSHQRGERPEESAQYVREWLTASFSRWEEWKSANPSTLLFVAYLRGQHPGVELRCQLVARLEREGFRYSLTQFTVGAPTGEGRMQWQRLDRLLDDTDFRPDIVHFQQGLQHALPNL
jgi:hypothetical protein